MTAEIRDEAEFRNDILERIAELEFKQNNFQIFETQNVSEKDPGLAVLESTETSSDNEKNSGDQSGALLINFTSNRFCRMRVIGDLVITFDVSSLLIGKWQQLTVEMLQDPTGQHTVTFADAPFENQVTPTVYKAANRYTTIRFYAYRLAVDVVRIFAFEEFQVFSQEFFDSYIQARITNDQVVNLNPNNHLEFNLKIATDNTISVSTGAGQVSGLFSNFKPGHLYQAECHYAIEGVSPSSELTIQFYNVTKGSFFGSQGRSQTTSHALQDSSLPVTKGFFIADAISDTIEVRIRAASGTNKIIAGVGSADPTSYVVIKDCGVAGLVNLEGNLIDAPLPSIAETILPLKGYTTGHFSISSLTPSDRSWVGEPSQSNLFPAMGSGKMKNIKTNILEIPGVNPGVLNVATMVNGPSATLGSGMATVDVHDRDGLDRAFVKDDIIGIRHTRTTTSGVYRYNVWWEIEYEATEFWTGSGLFTVITDTLRFSSILGSGQNQTSSGPDTLDRVASQRKFGRDGLIKDFVYYGTAEAGTGEAHVSIEVNGITVFTSPDLAVATSKTIFRFDNVNILIGPNDAVNCKVIMRDGVSSTGAMGARVIAL